MHEPPGLAARDPRIRPLDPRSDAEVDLVAARMRRTLVEVLGEERGTALHTMDWLRERVRWHLLPGRRAQVFLAEAPDGAVVGHTIVRVEVGEGGVEHGLFSTTYVAPEARGRGAATRLLQRGEQWMRASGVTRAITYTSATNVKLIHLYRKQGYTLRGGLAAEEDGSPMVELARALGPVTP